jgi:hypothetical protein
MFLADKISAAEFSAAEHWVGLAFRSQHCLWATARASLTRLSIGRSLTKARCAIRYRKDCESKLSQAPTAVDRRHIDDRF